MGKLGALLLAGGLALASEANAAPVARSADLTLKISLLGLPPITLSAPGATVMVDSSGGLGGAGQITIAAGALRLQTAVSIPVTSSTAIIALTAQTLLNQRGVFSIGGAGVDIPPSELPCPPARPGTACVQQTGLGGVMGLSGSIGVVLTPGPLTLFVPLSSAGIGQGGLVGSIPGGFFFDAAPWTTRTGSVAYLVVYTPGTAFYYITTTVTQMGTNSEPAGELTLVSPTYVYTGALEAAPPILSSLEIRFVPEPEAPELLVAVLGALALATWPRRQPGSAGSRRVARG